MKYYLVCHCRFCDVVRNVKEGWCCGNWSCKEYEDVVEAMNQFNKIIPFLDQVWNVYDEDFNVIAEKSSKRLTTPEMCKRTLEIKKEVKEEVLEGIHTENINKVKVEVKPIRKRRVNALDYTLEEEDL